MVVEPFDLWWCCLNPRERNMLISLIALWFTSPTYVPREVFDGLAIATGLASSIKMLEYFMLHYGLEYRDIPCGEECVIHAVVYTSGFWAQGYVFSQTAGYLCTAPCKLLTFSQ